MKLERILLTTDFSECSTGAFAPAASIARRHGAEIDLVTVGGALSPLTFGHSGPGHSLETYQKALEDKLAESAAGDVFEGVPVHPHVIGGFGPEAVDQFQQERKHDLLITATHGHSGLRRLLTGSFAERLVQLTKCSVLTVRGSAACAEFAPRRILVPHDFSELSNASFPMVRDLAAEYSSTLLLVHVLDHDLIPATDFPMTASAGAQYPVFWEEARFSAQRRLEEIATKELADCQFTTETLQGSPVREITSRASEFEADLIVMSTHGRTGLGHALLGSVAERVVRSSGCSVLTVRPQQEE